MWEKSRAQSRSREDRQLSAAAPAERQLDVETGVDRPSLPALTPRGNLDQHLVFKAVGLDLDCLAQLQARTV
jgi:hypothetical protein